MLSSGKSLPDLTIADLVALDPESTLIPDLLSLTRRATGALDVIREELYGEARVSHGELVAILYLLTSDPMSLSALGEGIHLSRAAVTALSDRLEGAGVALRANDPGDRRRILISIDALVRTRLLAAFVRYNDAQEQAAAEAEALKV